MTILRHSICFLFILCCCAIAFQPTRAAGKLYVDPVRGNDANSGTAPDMALASIAKARDVIRAGELNHDLDGNFTVLLRGGVYRLDATLVFDARDSGSNGHQVVYQAYGDEKPIISGGRRITGWSPVPGEPYQVAALKSYGEYQFPEYFGQIYVNGVRAERARSYTPVHSSASDWWDDPTTPEPADGVMVDLPELSHYTNPGDLRLLWVESFKAADVRVDRILSTDDGQTVIKVCQPDFLVVSQYRRKRAGITPESGFFIVNALEELDEPGEWYLDQVQRLVYYYPFQRDGDLNEAEVVAPGVEYLLRVSGTPENPVTNLRFAGITFEHGNWTAPRDHYLGLSQAEIFDDYRSELPGQVIFDYASGLEVVGCTFRHLASCGLQLYEGCHDILVEGNLCHDTTGAGIAVGRWWKKKLDCPPASVCTDITIRNNVIRNTGRDYWQATGISLFATARCHVLHNDVSDTAYGGIHARIGDTGDINPAIGQLEIKYNKVSRSTAGEKWGLGDSGNIYMHGRYPDSVVAENYSLYANRNLACEYYSDNFSQTVLWAKNVSRYSLAKYAYYGHHAGNVGVVFRGNYSDRDNPKIGNAMQTDFHWVLNEDWPAEARAIMANAGLEPAWAFLADNTYGHENLARGRPTSSYPSRADGSPSGAANDGDGGSYWTSGDAAGDSVAWWQVDLGKRYHLRKIALLPLEDKDEPETRRNLEVLGSNDPDFRDCVVLTERGTVPWYHKSGVSHSASSNRWEAFLPSGSVFRYIRICKTKSPEKLAIAECEVFGTEER